MMYIRSLVFLGAVAGIAELGLSEARSTTSMAQASAETIPSMTVETLAGYPELSPMDPVVLAQQKGSVTSTVSMGAPSSIQTRPSASIGQGAEPSSSEGFTLLGVKTTTNSPAWSPSATNTEVTTSTSQPPHSTATTKPTTIFQSSPTTKPTTVFQSSPTTKPTTVFQSSPTTKPTTVFQLSPTTKPTTVFQSSPTTKPTTVFQSSPTTKPTTISQSSPTTKSSTVSEMSSHSSPFDPSAQSRPASPSVSHRPDPSHSTPQPGSFKSIWLLVLVLLLVAVVFVVVIICCLRRRKRRHSQTFVPQRRRKGKVEDAWAGPVAMLEDGGQGEGAEEKEDEDPAAKRLSLPLSTFFGKRKSRAASMLIEEAVQGKASAQQPLLSTPQNGQLAEAQASEQRQGPATHPSSEDPSAREPPGQALLLPAPPALQSNGHLQEQGPGEGLPPPSPLSETLPPTPQGQSGQGEKPNSLSVKTSL